MNPRCAPQQKNVKLTGSTLLVSLRALLRYHHQCGMTGYPGAGRPLERLRRIGDGRAVAVSTRDRAPVAEPPAHDVTERALSSIAQIGEEVAVCQSCPLHHKRCGVTPGSGTERPRLLVVGEWLVCAPGAAPVPGDGRVFGEEEDLMLSRMMTAMGLTSADYFVTNVIKCAVPESLRPTGEHALVCAAYLRQQIDALQPDYICAMGTLSAQTLTGLARPISVLRGRVFTYRSAMGREMPVMPTFHPSFLLKNPEMKRAAWEDLQAIARQLRTEPAQQ